MMAFALDTTTAETLRNRSAEMVAATRRLVEAESPSSHPPALERCAQVVADVGSEVTGQEPELLQIDGRPHLRWRFGGPGRVALIGHFDTVWPVGTLARRPATEVDGRLLGPGVFDMKAGIVQAMFAIATLGNADGVEMLLTSDEEVGSPTSRPLIEELARRVGAALIIEPSYDGALKTARKGVSTYRIDVEGRSSHAGLEPEKGVNALVELAHVVLHVEQMARPGLGTSVTPTVAVAGTTINVVPALASLDVDVRTRTTEEQARVDHEMQSIRPTVKGAAVTVSGGANRPPLPVEASRALFAQATNVAERLGLGSLTSAEVGGGSDGNFAAGVGTPTLDGLGAVGGGAHAETEHVVISAMPERAALLAGLISELLG